MPSRCPLFYTSDMVSLSRVCPESVADSSLQDLVDLGALKRRVAGLVEKSKHGQCFWPQYAHECYMAWKHGIPLGLFDL